jgi:hypothetical protein
MSNIPVSYFGFELNETIGIVLHIQEIRAEFLAAGHSLLCLGPSR